jgi:hypothetical protein
MAGEREEEIENLQPVFGQLKVDKRVHVIRQSNNDETLS